MKTLIEDEFFIRNVIESIDNAVDAKDWAKARSFFTENIYVDFSSLAGGSAVEITSDQLIAAWEKNLYAGKKSFHLRGNHQITINGNTASDYSKAYAINAIDKGPVTGIWEIWGDYVYTLLKESDGWKVTGMTLLVVETRGDDKIRTYLEE